MKCSTFAVLMLSGLVLFPVAARAVDGPQLRPGLWETHFQHSSDGKGADKPNIAQVCLDSSALAHGKQIAEDYARKNCSKYETRHEGGKWVIDMLCMVGGSTMNSHTVTDAGSDNAYHTVTTATYDPPVAGRSRTSTIIDGKWLGTCKPD